MNAELAFNRDPYLKTLQTQVHQLREGRWLELDDTIFYPTGGGQPGDSGVVVTKNGSEFIITNTRKCRDTGAILHELNTDTSDFKQGDSVTLTLDWERRFAHMRMHTCMHLLSAVIPFGVAGGGLTDRKGRLDFALEGSLPDKKQLTEKLNALIQQGEPVSTEMLDESVLDQQPELVKTMSVQPPKRWSDSYDSGWAG